MNDSAVSYTASHPLGTDVGGPACGWLLLIHQLPADPAYLRVKVLRRLKGIGALALKNSVYVLPDLESCREDFQWVIREIVDNEGAATLSTALFLEGTSDHELRDLFNRERDREYAQLVESADDVAARGPGRTDIERIARTLNGIRERDHFQARGRPGAEAAVVRLEGIVRGDDPGNSAGGDPRPSGATWVTRKGVLVDRMASAWLIRRFIDQRARFRFLDASARSGEREIAFDMFEGGYSHEGDRCTFETLIARFRLSDPGLVPIGEIVHDIDCKDDKFARAETAGVASLLRGIAKAHARDADRIVAAAHVFDHLLSGFQSETVEKRG